MKYTNVLLKYANTSNEMQQEHKKEICIAFKELLKTNPSKEEFSNLTGGILLFPEMLYDIWKHNG